MKNLKFQILCVGSVRVVSGVAKLASRYDCSNTSSFPDIMFYVVFSKVFKKNDLIVFEKMEFRYPIAGC